MTDLNNTQKKPFWNQDWFPTAVVVGLAVPTLVLTVASAVNLNKNYEIESSYISELFDPADYFTWCDPGTRELNECISESNEFYEAYPLKEIVNDIYNKTLPMLDMDALAIIHETDCMYALELEIMDMVSENIGDYDDAFDAAASDFFFDVLAPYYNIQLDEYAQQLEEFGVTRDAAEQFWQDYRTEYNVPVSGSTFNEYCFDYEDRTKASEIWDTSNDISELMGENVKAILGDTITKDEYGALFFYVYTRDLIAELEIEAGKTDRNSYSAGEAFYQALHSEFGKLKESMSWEAAADAAYDIIEDGIVSMPARMLIIDYLRSLEQPLANHHA